MQMFVRLFVDENLDRIVPISKQPKEKIQAIIDSCTRQFPEFAERARKRIRTYLKSCRRNKRSRDTNGAWDATRPTPAHLTSVQAEQILAQACENESHNAKRMRLGLEPVSQPLPILPSSTTTDSRPSPMDHHTSPLNFESTKPSAVVTSNSATIKTEPIHPVDSGLSSTFNSVAVSKSTGEAMAKSVGTTVSTTTMNGSATSSSAAPTALYRPNFTQAFQRAATTGPYTNPLFPTPPFGTGGIMSNAVNCQSAPKKSWGYCSTIPANQYPYNRDSLAGQYTIARVTTTISDRADLYSLLCGQFLRGNCNWRPECTSSISTLCLRPHSSKSIVDADVLPCKRPTDLSMKTKPLLSHKLNTAEMAAVRQLITGYRESAAFLLRSADELEQLLLQQQ
uniref:Nucleolar protein 4 helical domain-containing protein n=1 Tax=Timema douglasi TaxID=61478 RepID=A0A7R8Z668_TIMDO|nr:unnamed protein product [Timema douglasi]